MIKRNELDETRYSQLIGKHSQVFIVKPSTACISGSNQLIYAWFSAKCGIKNGRCNYLETENFIRVTSDSIYLIVQQMYNTIQLKQQN